LLVGGPDMANKTGPLKNICNNYINKFNKCNIRHYSNKINKNDLGSYLAGLFEGDGHIWIQNTFSGKNHNPRFCITFGLKNEPLAKKLLEIIESGFIRYKNNDNACVIVISSVVGLKKIVYLINGKLRTPKIRQLEALINWLNKNHNVNILLLPICDNSLLSDAWLSGFIDADGSFSVQYTKKENAKKRKISCRLRIEQRMIDPSSNNSYFDILNKIATFLLCNLLTRTQSTTGNTYYTLTASSLESLKVIIDYFNKYSLYSSKYLDYKDWEKVAKLRLNNEHYLEDGITKVKLAKSSMNNSRTYFNWGHLNNFPKN
jgi:LAGLIDADG endonuclease